MNTVLNISPIQNNTILPHVVAQPAGSFLTTIPFEISTLKPQYFKHAERRTIQGFEQYSISSDGDVYQGSRLLIIHYKKYGSGRVNLRNAEGKAGKRSVAKLLAISFIPNPHGYTKIIFKDRDYRNCTTDNLEWVSQMKYSRFVKKLDDNDLLLGPKKKVRQPDWVDPERVPVMGYPGYFITPSAVVYKKDFICHIIKRKGKSLKVRLRCNGIAKYAGLATLMAQHFIPNPRGHNYIIFKDRDSHNCQVNNIAWVDNETWMFYCGMLRGGKKIMGSREEAINKCTDVYLLNYYKTLDESWLHDCWAEVEKKINLHDWNALRAECYLYFIDRAQRFSLYKNPIGLLLKYIQGVRSKIKKEISDNMPASAARRMDESLRNLKDLD